MSAAVPSIVGLSNYDERMKNVQRRVPGLHEGLRELWEDETLALFINSRRIQGGPNYEFVEQRERPDRVIRSRGVEFDIGVEITRAVETDDARLGKAAFLLGHAMQEAFKPWCSGGRCELYAGDFPPLDPASIANLATSLSGALHRAGGVSQLNASLGGKPWRFGASYWYFDPDPSADGWKFHSNGVVQKQQAELAPGRFLELLCERLRDKCKKGISYPWTGPLFLLVRNPYRTYVPTPVASGEIAEALAGSPYREVWLVNYRQGALEAAPPPTTIVRLA